MDDETFNLLGKVPRKKGIRFHVNPMKEDGLREYPKGCRNTREIRKNLGLNQYENVLSLTAVVAWLIRQLTARKKEGENSSPFMKQTYNPEPWNPRFKHRYTPQLVNCFSLVFRDPGVKGVVLVVDFLIEGCKSRHGSIDARNRIRISHRKRIPMNSKSCHCGRNHPLSLIVYK